MDSNKVIFERLVNGLLEIYGCLLYSIVLYGSVARGTHTEESDIDAAVLLKDGQTREMRDKMTDLVVGLLEKFLKEISNRDFIKFDEKYK